MNSNSRFDKQINAIKNKVLFCNFAVLKPYQDEYQTYRHRQNRQ
jgi:hypothetical protein